MLVVSAASVELSIGSCPPAAPPCPIDPAAPLVPPAPAFGPPSFMAPPPPEAPSVVSFPPSEDTPPPQATAAQLSTTTQPNDLVTGFMPRIIPAHRDFDQISCGSSLVACSGVGGRASGGADSDDGPDGRGVGLTGGRLRLRGGLARCVALAVGGAEGRVLTLMVAFLTGGVPTTIERCGRGSEAGGAADRSEGADAALRHSLTRRRT